MNLYDQWSRLKSRSKRLGAFGAASAAALAIVATLSAPTALFAQSVRHYDYANIAIIYAVQKDSTVVVTEQQTYDFTGTYHQGERVIPQKGSDAITNVSIIDSSTGQQLVYAGSRALDKTSPDSWGKYTVTDSGGNMTIDWYYNLADTTHTWVLTYTLHGAITFAKDHDELYWNLFNAYTVPVLQTSATVVLPVADTQPTATFYVNGEHGVVASRPDDHTFRFSASNFAPSESATVAVGWQKGVVDEAAYRRSVYAANWPYGVALILAALTALFYFGFWLAVEKIASGRRTIVAEYAPPENLPPAMGELVLRERLTKRAWPATIVDLAVRGHLTIQEDPPTFWPKAFAIIGRIAVWGGFLAVCSLFGVIYFRAAIHGVSTILVFLILILLLAFVLFGQWFNFKSWVPKDYILTRRTAQSGSPAPLRAYEEQLLTELFAASYDGTFSTRAFRKSPSQAQGMRVALQLLKQKLFEETDIDTNAFEKKLAARVVGFRVLLGFVVMGCVPFILMYAGMAISGAYATLFAVVLTCAGVVLYRIKYDPRLNAAGQELRAKVLGFKLYLATAERYRMQNLTPETFEKYLPYAMIFGIEKKWARAFAGMQVAAPQWYGGPTSSVGIAVSTGASSFSPITFSSGFSASFASAFGGAVGSGVSGAAGGGCSAGGGGGGGGGGAS